MPIVELREIRNPCAGYRLIPIDQDQSMVSCPDGVFRNRVRMDQYRFEAMFEGRQLPSYLLFNPAINVLVKRIDIFYLPQSILNLMNQLVFGKSRVHPAWPMTDPPVILAEPTTAVLRTLSAALSIRESLSPVSLRMLSDIRRLLAGLFHICL